MHDFREMRVVIDQETHALGENGFVQDDLGILHGAMGKSRDDNSACRAGIDFALEGFDEFG